MTATNFDYRQQLKQITWAADKTTHLALTSYRHRTVIHCSRHGRQEAEFANGRHPYFAYTELVGSDGQKNRNGVNIVPILPNGRYLMIVEDRPPTRDFYPPSVLHRDNNTIDVRKCCPNPSLEFPEGAIEPGQTIKIGALSELVEETGIPPQALTLYQKSWPHFPFGCDVSHAHHFAAAFLDQGTFKDHIPNDGGLAVVELAAHEINRAINEGVIHAVQSGMALWWWFIQIVVPYRQTYYTRCDTAEKFGLCVERVHLTP